MGRLSFNVKQAKEIKEIKIYIKKLKGLKNKPILIKFIINEFNNEIY